MNSQTALGIGLVCGVALSAIAVMAMQPKDPHSAPSRPADVPPAAVWVADAFGQAGWISCEPAEQGTSCVAFAADGAKRLEGNFVPRGKKGPEAPFNDVIAGSVDRLFLNKIAMVPEGTVKFPSANKSVDYANGARAGEPQ